MNLSPTLRKRIEGFLQEGTTVEVRLQEDGQVTVFPRPNKEEEVLCTPTLIDEANRTTLILVAKKHGDIPIQVLSVEIEAGYWVGGLKVFKGISQEIPEEE